MAHYISYSLFDGHCYLDNRSNSRANTCIKLYVFTRCDRLRPNTLSLRFSSMLSVKSSVDDFDIELGIVRVRVGLSYDPLRLSPCSGDL